MTKLIKTKRNPEHFIQVKYSKPMLQIQVIKKIFWHFDLTVYISSTRGNSRKILRFELKREREAIRKSFMSFLPVNN